MIKVAAGELTVRDGNAGYGSLDMERLQDDLWAACADAGVHDPHLPGDLTEIVRVYVRRSDPLPDQDAVNALVARLLGDCGLHEAARCWCARRSQDSLPVLGELLAVEPATVRQQLARDRFYPEQPDAHFVTAVVDTLKNLGLFTCNAALLRELSRHLWIRDRMAAEAAVPPPPGSEPNTWLIRPADYPSLLTPQQLSWLDSGAIRLRPVSRLLPRIDLTLDLKRLLAAHATDAPLGELILGPALDDLCRATVAIVEQLHDAASQRIRPEDRGDLVHRITVRRIADYTAAMVPADSPPRSIDLPRRIQRALTIVRDIPIIWD